MLYDLNRDFNSFYFKSSQHCLRRHFRRFFRSNFRLEVVRDVISSANVGQVGMDVPVKFGDSRSNTSLDIRQQSCWSWHLRPFFYNSDNCQPEAVSDVISVVVVDPTGVKVHVKFELVENYFVYGQNDFLAKHSFVCSFTTKSAPPMYRKPFCIE